MYAPNGLGVRVPEGTGGAVRGRQRVVTLVAAWKVLGACRGLEGTLAVYATVTSSRTKLDASLKPTNDTASLEWRVTILPGPDMVSAFV